MHFWVHLVFTLFQLDTIGAVHDVKQSLSSYAQNYIFSGVAFYLVDDQLVMQKVGDDE